MLVQSSAHNWTEHEIKNFLVDNKLNIHLGTIDDNGDPTFILLGIISIPPTIAFMLRHPRIHKNLNGNSIIYYCVDDPNPPYKGVRGKGKIKIHEDVGHNIPIAEYLGSETSHILWRRLL